MSPVLLERLEAVEEQAVEQAGEAAQVEVQAAEQAEAEVQVAGQVA
jgi:hypothetical protein